MSKLWPFANKSKALEAALKQEIKELHNKIEDVDLEDELREIEYKSFSTADSSSSLGGMVGVVDEYYDKAMLQRLYSTETWFFIAVHTIAKTIAALPIKLEKRKKIQQNIAQSDGTVDKIQKETWIDASAEPEFDILCKPNALQSSVEFWMLVVIDLMATGDAFIYVDKGDSDVDMNETSETPEARLRRAIDKRRKSKIRGMYRLSSGLIRPNPSSSDQKVLAGYMINTEFGIFTFGVEEVIHIRLPNPVDPFYGLAPIIAVMKNILLDKYSAEHMIRFYKQGARLGGVIKTTKKLTKDQLVRIERVFESNFTGKRNHHKTLILPEGMEYDTIEQNPGETSLIEFLKANKEPILAAYNMPPVKVGLLDGATYANAMIQEKTYYNDTIKPICRIVEECINQHGSILPKMRELKFSFSFDQIEALKEDEAQKATAARGMLDSGMSINEVREKVWRLPPVQGGEVVPAVEKAKPAAPFIPFGDKSAKTEATNSQNDTVAISDVKPTNTTFETRVSELVAQAIGQGIDPIIAVPKAIDQALQEGFSPSKKDEDGEKKTELNAPIFTKEFLSEFQKQTTGDGISHLIEERVAETNAFFDRFEKFLLKKVKSKKSFSIKVTKAENGEDGGGFFSENDLESFFKSEIDRLYESDQKAMRHGYKQSISSRPMTFPNEKASKFLKDVGAKHIKSITETTRKRINGILSDSFDDQVGVGEIASRIRDVFPEIKAGRATTIARTETLTAVSLGQSLKTREFRSAYPEDGKRLRKMWISAQDERVRDSHADLDGKSVGIDEEFKSGLKFPRDPDCDDAGEIINCRCATIEYFPEDQEEIESTMSNGSSLAEDVEEAE
jgi:HK97 family phage portal protein